MESDGEVTGMTENDMEGNSRTVKTSNDYGNR